MAKNKKNNKNETNNEVIEYAVDQNLALENALLKSRMMELKNEIVDLKDTILDLAQQNMRLEKYNKSMYQSENESEIYYQHGKEPFL
jgi:cell division protein FtsB